MKELESYEDILQRMLSNVPDTVDKRQGSIIYDALAPIAVELAQANIQLAGTLDLVFVNTSYGEFLDKLVQQQGITRKPATMALRKGIFNKEIPINSRFSIEDTTYITKRHIEGFTYELQCEQAGDIGNRYYGTMTPITVVGRLEKAELADIIQVGDNEETDESLKERYVKYITAPQFGGNISDYVVKTSSITGVGGVKVIPIWDGGGTVKLIITNSEHKPANKSLVDTVQEIIDPKQDQQGLGIAPIGHKVTVEGATSTSIKVNAVIHSDLVDILPIEQQFQTEVEQYFDSLNATWQELENIVVRVSQLEMRLLNIPGVIDVDKVWLAISGEDQPVGANYTLDPYKVIYTDRVDLGKVV